MRDGKVNAAVPVVLGSVRDELSNSLMLGNIMPKMTEAEFDTYTAHYGANAAKVKEIYRPGGTYPYPAVLGKYSQWWWAAMRSATDSTFVCPARRAARWLVDAGAPAVYEYLYAHPPAPTDAHAWGAAGVTVPHGIEVNYVFHCGGFDSMAKGSANLREYNCTFAEADEKGLADTISSYWLNFASTGDPNGAALPQWPKVAAAGDMLLRFDVAPAGIVTQSGLRKDACDFLDTLLQ